MGTPEDQPTRSLDWVVLKVAQRCNLNCTYCYVYNRGDDSWKHRPAVISDEVAVALARRIAEHCTKYGLKRFVVEFHGGEPLLLGKARMQRLVDLLRAESRPVELRFLLQTNGVLLDEEWLALFKGNEITFGISLDGPPETADRHRIFPNGKGSTGVVLQNIERLRRTCPGFQEFLGGILCVVDPTLNGGDVVRWFVSHEFTRFEFLLPDGNYVNPPQDWSGAASTRRFLLEAFDAWYAMGEKAPEIRLFETMLLGFMGMKPELDALGGDLRQLCVVESDGSLGISDVIRFCHPDYAFDKLNVLHDPMDARNGTYGIDEIQRPCEKCQACSHLQSCGGGYLPHRFDGKSFANPSIYCEALYALGERMVEVIRADVPASLLTTFTSQTQRAVSEQEL
jgi:uncharacterized protein